MRSLDFLADDEGDALRRFGFPVFLPSQPANEESDALVERSERGDVDDLRRSNDFNDVLKLVREVLHQVIAAEILVEKDVQISGVWGHRAEPQAGCDSSQPTLAAGVVDVRRRRMHYLWQLLK